MENSYMVFSGTATRYLAEKICQSLGCPLGQLQITKFSDGEFAVSYEESIRGRDIFLVQSTFPNSDNLMELLLMIDAAKRASARTINAVIPYFGWARQDRKDKPRVSIGAKLIADLLSVAGVNRVITMDLHADQIQGFFDVPVDHLYASGVIMPYLKSLQLDDMVIASPDVGGSKRANTYAKYFGCPLVLAQNMNATTIITVALATVVLLIIIGLAVGLVYYRWRTTELLTGFSEFIRQNRKLEDEVNELSRESNHNNDLPEELSINNK